jgi:hypothetical protein
MAKPKVPFMVYSRYFFVSEDDHFERDWSPEGQTFAVSEAQAINNVRHRNYGDYGTSQYKPIATSGHWENGLEWKAERI